MELRLETKTFAQGEAPVLRDIELEIGAGEFLALLGPSGVGKTTLLRILGGLDENFGGTLRGRESGAPIGFLFQEARLMPWLTAEENVALVVGGDRSLARQALESDDLVDAAGRYPHQLSGGMQRRVALARAIAPAPSLLLLDEPFVSLDFPAAEALRDVLLRYWQRAKTTVVLVSHNLEEALCLADRLVFLGEAPATIIEEHSVALPRPRELGGALLRERCEDLLRTRPGLLAGNL